MVALPASASIKAADSGPGRPHRLVVRCRHLGVHPARLLDLALCVHRRGRASALVHQGQSAWFSRRRLHFVRFSIRTGGVGVRVSVRLWPRRAHGHLGIYRGCGQEWRLGPQGRGPASGLRGAKWGMGFIGISSVHFTFLFSFWSMFGRLFCFLIGSAISMPL